MTLDIESSRQLRSDSQLRSLVRAVIGAHSSDEQHFVEWKAALDLGKAAKESHFIIGKCILAMANRPVEYSHNYFGGCGYMIIGAEPGQLHGAVVPDLADLEPWVQRYTGTDGPTWSGHPVRVDEMTVLVVIVEPPNDGDPIFPLMRTWAPEDKTKRSHSAGTIFVRHQARSEPATPADLDALQQRLLAGHSGPARMDGVTVASNRPDAIQVVDIDQDAIDAEVTAERERLVLPAERTDSSGFGFGFQLGKSLEQEALDSYGVEREQYLLKFKSALPAHTLHTLLARRQGLVRLTVTNNSTQPLQDVRIRMRLPDDILAFEEAADVDGGLPKRPLPPSRALSPGAAVGLGYFSPPVMRTPDLGLMQKHISVSHDGSEVTLSISSLHPLETADTDSFVLIAPLVRSEADADIHSVRTASLVISAGNRSNVSESTVAFSTTGAILSVADLVAR